MGDTTVSVMLTAALALGCSSTDEASGGDPSGTGAGASTTTGSGTGSGTSASSGSGGASSSFTSCVGTSAAHRSFNAFWSVFDQKYALFDIRMPDESWAAIGEEACAKLTDTTAGKDLFDLLIGMARHLDDGHSNLEAPELGLAEDAWVSAYPYYEQMYELETNAD